MYIRTLASGHIRAAGGFACREARNYLVIAPAEGQEGIVLKRGLERAVPSTEPLIGSVRVTQDRRANEPYPEADCVWVFNGPRAYCTS